MDNQKLVYKAGKSENKRGLVEIDSRRTTKNQPAAVTFELLRNRLERRCTFSTQSNEHWPSPGVSPDRR